MIFFEDDINEIFFYDDDEDSGDSYDYESEPIYYNELAENYPLIDYEIDFDNAEYEKLAYRND